MADKTPEQIAAEQAAADKAAADKDASDKAAADKLAADKVAADKAEADRLADEARKTSSGDESGEAKRLRAEAEAERKKRQEAEAELAKLRKAEEDRNAEELRKKGEFEQLAQQEREKREQAERERDELAKARVQDNVDAIAREIARDLGLIDLDLIAMVDLKDVPVGADGKPNRDSIAQRFDTHKAAKPALYPDPADPKKPRTTATPPASRGGTGETDWSKKSAAEIKAERDRLVGDKTGIL